MLHTGFYAFVLFTLLAGGCSDDGPAPPTDALGPGAALKCESSGKNAFDTYGQATFFAVTKAIFRNVFAELAANGEANLGDSLGKSGTGAPPSTSDDLATFEGKVASYLVWAYGGPPEITYSDGIAYPGPQDMTAAHLGQHITSAQYDFFATNIVVPSLTGSGVKAGAGGAADPNDVASCFAPVVTNPAYKAAMVGK